MITKERKLEGGREGGTQEEKMEVNGFQKRRRYLCNATLREIKDAEERGQLSPESPSSPLGGRSWDIQTHVHAWVHSAWFCCIPKRSSHGWMYSEATLDSGQGEGRNSWLKERYFLKLHQTMAPPKVPHILSLGSIPIPRALQVYKQPGVGREGKSGGGKGNRL